MTSHKKGKGLSRQNLFSPRMMCACFLQDLVLSHLLVTLSCYWLRNNDCVSGHSNFLKASFYTLVCSRDIKLFKSALFLYVCSHRSPRQLLWVSGQHLWKFFPIAFNISRLNPSSALILYRHVLVSCRRSHLTKKTIKSPRNLDIMGLMGSSHCFNSILSRNVTVGAECGCSGWEKLCTAAMSVRCWETSNLQPC